MNLLTNVGPNALRYWTEPLLEAHFQESARGDWVLKPDWDTYRTLYEQEHLLNVIAVENDQCVGYAVNILTHHLHYMDTRISQNDVIFVTPEARASAGGRIMVAMRRLSKQWGAAKLLWHAKFDTPLYDTLAARHKPHEAIFVETL